MLQCSLLLSYFWELFIMYAIVPAYNIIHDQRLPYGWTLTCHVSVAACSKIQLLYLVVSVIHMVVNHTTAFTGTMHLALHAMQ